MGDIVRRRKQRKRGNENKVTDYSPEMLEMLARRRKYDEWRGEDADNGSVDRDTDPVLRRICDGEKNRTR